MCRAKHNGGRRCTQHRAYQAVSNSRRRIQRGEEKMENLNKLEEQGEDVAEKKKRLDEKLERDRKAYDADVAHYREAAYGMDDESLGDEDRVPVQEEAAPAESPAEEKPAEPARQDVRTDENTEGAVRVANLSIGDKVSYYSNVKIGTSTLTNPDGTSTTEEHWHETKFSGEIVGRRENVGGIGYFGYEVRDENGESHVLNQQQYAVLDEKAPETVEEVPATPAPVKEEKPAKKKTSTKKAPKTPAATPVAAAPVVADADDEGFDLDAAEPDLDSSDDSVDADLDFDEWAKKEGFNDVLEDDVDSTPTPSSNPLFDDEEDDELGYGADTEGWG